MRKCLFVLLVGAILAVTACSGTLPLEPPTATPVPTAKNTVVPPTSTPYVAPTAVPPPTATQHVVQPTPYPTYTPAPTYAPSPAPTSTPVPPTAVPTVALTSPPVPTQVAGASVSSGGVSTDAHVAHFSRLESLDPTFRSQGLEAWLKAAGLSWDSIQIQARQIEEETNPSSGKVSASGVQVDAKNLRANWPVIVTTDVPSRVTTSAKTVQFQPDARNGSTLYTNVVANGPVTVWVSGLAWSQFTSRLGMVSGSQPAPTVASTSSTASGCLTISQLDAKYGIDKNAQGTRSGLLYDGDVLSGAAIKVNADQIKELEAQGWTIQGSNPSVKSAWSPNSCRPLKN